MNCKNVKQQMIFLAEGSLQPEMAGVMQEHLAQCSQCSHVYQEIEQTLAMIQTEKQVKVDPWFAGRVEQQLINLQNENKRKVIKLNPALTLVRIIPVAASLIIALFLGIFIGSELNVKFTAGTGEDNFPSTFYEELVAEDLYERSFETFFLTNGDN